MGRDRDRRASAVTARSGLRYWARRSVGPALFLASVMVVVALAVVPTRTFFHQRAATAEAEERLATLRDTNARLQGDLDALRDDADLERIARQQYGFVKPGEEVYRIIEPPKPPVTVPGVWPFVDLGQRLNATHGAVPAPPTDPVGTPPGSSPPGA